VYQPPKAAVVAVVTVVTHHKIIPLRYYDRPTVAFGLFYGAGGGYSIDVRLINPLAIAFNTLVRDDL
jgi:hypothetical protein